MNTRKQFDGKSVERTTKARPNTSMVKNGDFDWQTNKKADFKGHDVRKQEKMKAEDNLKPLEGKLKGKTESKSQFDGKQADRTLVVRPNTTMMREGDFDWNTHKRENFGDPGIKSVPQRATQKDNLNLMPKDAKLEGASVSKSTYQNHPRSRSAGAEPRQRYQKTNLKLLDAPLEGVSEMKSNFDGKAFDSRSKSLDRPRPDGNLELNKNSPFTQKQSTTPIYDYKTARPEVVSAWSDALNLFQLFLRQFFHNSEFQLLLR